MVVGRVQFAPGAGQARSTPRDFETVTLTADDHPALAQTLERHLLKRRADLVELLAKSPAKDYAEYQKRCGIIEGLDIAIAAARTRNEELKA